VDITGPIHQDRFVRPSGICPAIETRHAVQKSFFGGIEGPDPKKQF
jgi:hypothetical protein